MSEQEPPARSDATDATDATDETAPAASAENRPMTFMERARIAAAQAAKIGAEVGGQAAKVGAEVGAQAAKAGAEMGSKAAATAAATIRDPATKAKAQSALKKAKRGFTTALERIDPKILADVVVKATSLQERANASLQARGSVYRIGEIGIGASIPPSITFTIERIDDPGALDSTTLMSAAGDGVPGDGDGTSAETIVTLDGTAIDDATIDEAANEA